MGPGHTWKNGCMQTLDVLATGAAPGISAIDALDPEVAAAIHFEETRQRENLELIASENYASRAVREALASVLTNKYAEGYPGRRYYGGCEFVDLAEQLAIDRAKQIFGADHANVQPHAGAQEFLRIDRFAVDPGLIMQMRTGRPAG